MSDDKIDMDAVCATLDDAVREANIRNAAQMLVSPAPPPRPIPIVPKVVGIFDKQAVVIDDPMSPDVKEVLDQVMEIAKETGPNKVISVGAFLMHADGTTTRAFYVESGNWCACLGAVEHLKWSMHAKYNGPT